MVSTSSRRRAAAFSESQKLILNPEPAHQDRHVVLEGTVLRMALIRRTAQVVVTVAVGDLTLTAILDAEAFKAGRLLPGDAIRVAYRPEDVRWLDALDPT